MVKRNTYILWFDFLSHGLNHFLKKHQIALKQTLLCNVLSFDFREDGLDLRHFEWHLFKVHWFVISCCIICLILWSAFVCILLFFKISLGQDIGLRDVNRHVAERDCRPVYLGFLLACPDDRGVQLGSRFLVVQLFFVDNHAAVTEIGCFDVLLLQFTLWLRFRLCVRDYDVFLLLQSFFDARGPDFDVPEQLLDFTLDQRLQAVSC